MTKQRSLVTEFDKIYGIKCNGAFVSSRFKRALVAEKCFFKLKKVERMTKGLKTDNCIFNNTNDNTSVIFSMKI